MDAIPSTVALTAYSGGIEDFLATPLDQLVEQMAQGRLYPPAGPVFHIEQIVEAHRCMVENRASGKIVVLT